MLPEQHVSLSLHPPPPPPPPPPPQRRVTAPRLYAQFLVLLQKDQILIPRLLLQRNVQLNEPLSLVLRLEICIFFFNFL